MPMEKPQMAQTGDTDGRRRPITHEGVPIDQLSTSEKLQLVEEIWDDLAATPEEIPVHDWQRDELDQRKAAHASDPASGLTWQQVKRDIRHRHMPQDHRP